MKWILSLRDNILELLPFIGIVLGTAVIPLFVFPALRQPLVLSKEVLVLWSVGGSLFFWMLRTAVTKKMHIRRTILDIPLLLFVGLVVLSMLFSRDISTSLVGVVDEFVLHGSLLIACVLLVWLMVQEVRTERRWKVMLTTFFLSNLLVSALFLMRSFGIGSVLYQWFGLSGIHTNTISQFNSGFGLYLVIGIAIATGVLVIRSREWWLQLLAFAMVLFHSIALLRIDFPVVWVFAAAVCVGIIAFGWFVVSQLRIGVLSAALFFLVCSVLFAIFSTDMLRVSGQGLREQLPAEVTLSAPASWQIMSQAALQSPKILLVGAGPAQFESLFSLYRPASFNNNPLVWSLRFRQPYNTLLEMVSSVGLLGFASFLVITLMSIGAMITSWRVLRRHEHAVTTVVMRHIQKQSTTIGLEGFFIGIAWLVSTVGMGLLFYDVVLWVMWWWLLAMTMIGVSVVSSHLIREKQLTITLSAQQALLMSFSLVLVFVCGTIFSVFLYRQVRAETWYSKATSTYAIAQTKQYLTQAMNERPGYGEYRIAFARVLLEEARQASEAETADDQAITVPLAQAVNTMKTLTEEKPYSIPAWETLALLYMNSRAIAPEANEWASDAIEKALSYDPNNPVFYWQLGNIHEFAKRYQDAERSYNRAIQLKPDYIAAYSSLAALYEKQEEYDEAIATYEKILTQQPTHVVSLYHMGRMYFNRATEGDYAQAEALWKRALQLDSRYVDALYSLGLLQEQQGNRTQARRYYEQVLTIDPDNTQAKERLRY